MIHVKFISDPARTNISGDPTIAVTGTVMGERMEERENGRVSEKEITGEKEEKKRIF